MRISFTVSTEAFEKLSEIAHENFTTPNMVARALVEGSMQQLHYLGRQTESGDIEEDGTINRPETRQGPNGEKVILDAIDQFRAVAKTDEKPPYIENDYEYKQYVELRSRDQFAENEIDPYWDERGKNHQNQEG